jgi:hypothetical protein
MLPWSPRKKLSTVQPHTRLTLVRVVVPGEEVENTLTLWLFCEGLYEGFASLRGDMVPWEEVTNNLTL